MARHKDYTYIQTLRRNSLKKTCKSSARELRYFREFASISNKKKIYYV